MDGWRAEHFQSNNSHFYNMAAVLMSVLFVASMKQKCRDIHGWKHGCCTIRVKASFQFWKASRVSTRTDIKGKRIEMTEWFHPVGFI